jgi:hypothetical protein
LNLQFQIKIYLPRNEGDFAGQCGGHTKKIEIQMRLDYIVSRIEAHKDGALYVYITYSYSGDFNAGTYKNTAGYSFGPSMRITSPKG